MLSVDQVFKKMFPNKRPKLESLEALQPIIARMINNYHKIDFNALFAKYCPLPDNYMELKNGVTKINTFFSNSSKEGKTILF